MDTQQWYEGNRTVLMAAIAAIRLQLRNQPNGEAMAIWQQAEAAFAGQSRLRALAETFQLSNFELQIVVLCAGEALDPNFTADETLQRPTFQRMLQTLANSHWQATAPDSPLRYWQIITVEEPEDFLHSRLRLDERILHYLLGVPTMPQPIIGLLTRVTPPEMVTPSQQATVRHMVALHQPQQGTNRVPVVLLSSKDRATNRAVAAYAYQQLHLQTFAVQADDLPTNTSERLRLLRLLERETLLNPAALYIDAFALSEVSRASLSIFATQFNGLLTIGAAEPLQAIGRSTVRLELTHPTVDEQITLWQQALGPLVMSLNGTLPQLARQFDLSAGTIQQLGTQLRSELSPDSRAYYDKTQIETRLRTLCGDQSQPELDALCQRVESHADWSDLVLPDEQRRILEEVVQHVERRFQVYYDWGFARQNNRGLGISALFVGDSGTGKTLAAEILANHLRLPLYRIELNAVVSKYIGETEKNLARIFDAAETMGAVLLFDEADALFGKRSEVRDAHDRYANIEVSYLLQRMEAYRGLAILTTNFKRNLDGAFLRRLRFIVHFPFPGPAERARIWQQIFPAQTPLAPLDYAKLAQLNVAGGYIKNIALRATFHAAHQGESVSIHHILRAAQGEYHKLEKPLTNAEIKGWV
ncbi:MAG: ATP-binding protein [Caldilineaceae bacterium]